MVFTVKVFEPNGCQRQSKQKEIRMQQISTLPNIEQPQEAPSGSVQKRCKNDWRSSDGKKKPKHSMTCLNKESLQRKSFYEIGPTSWIRKQINTNTLERELALAAAFCDAIGLREPCTITLQTSTDSTKSWQVCGLPCKNRSYRLAQGCAIFCQENGLKEGDICTFNVVKTTLWHVIIERCEEKINELSYQEIPPLSNWRCKRKIDRSSSKGKKRPKGSMTSLNKASKKITCVFEIGPPAWILKEINASTIGDRLYLPPVFCKAIGVREPCVVTLKTSMSSTRSWQARVVPYYHSSYHVAGPGWRSFCQENGIKVGDICAINIFETTLWHVAIAC